LRPGLVARAPGQCRHPPIPAACQAALNAFGLKWQVEFLGPPVSKNDQPTG
jgi:hypothetical protein